MLKPVHVDPFSAEFYLFQLETRTLLVGGSATQFDLATCTNNSVPWQLINWVQPKKLGNGSMVAWVAGSSGNTTIGADLAGRDGENHPAKRGVALLVLSKRISKERSLASLHRDLIEAESFRQSVALRFRFRSHLSIGHPCESLGCDLSDL
jgi:hypothetical protein